MKKIKYLFLLLLIAVISSFSVNISVYASENELYLGGFPAGFSLETRGAFVMGLSDVITSDGLASPCKAAGVVVGDVILSIDGFPVNTADDVEKTLIDGNAKTLEIKRCGEKTETEVMPAKDLSGKYKLGVFIRDGVNGIGTVTFIKENRFASLGHPVIDESGKPVEITGGELYPCNITGYVKGERGAPGELRGVFLKTDNFAKIEKNLTSGVYGDVNQTLDKGKLRKIEKGEGRIGNACIYTTINGKEPSEYSISIVKANADLNDVKNYVIKITDKELLSATGGIVQGMSGSPIIQDGKLVGAVTHVFINDPSRGFGISVDNMLNN